MEREGIYTNVDFPTKVPLSYANLRQQPWQTVSPVGVGWDIGRVGTDSRDGFLVLLVWPQRARDRWLLVN